ncbi:MAG: CPBP family intramembrane metalloprotease [Bacteroidales bacterium]|nr:CPBP family intramembrane metalloprotease [Candidatus Liminaster caballi]
MKFWSQFWLLLLLVAAGFALSMLTGVPAYFLRTSGRYIEYLHVIQWGQNIFVMILAPLAWARLVDLRNENIKGWGWKESFNDLRLVRPDWRFIILTLCLMAVSLPMLSNMEVFFSTLPLPDALREYCETELMQNYMVIGLLLRPSGILAWTEQILLLCVTTAIGEELLFRGAMLKCFSNCHFNRHAAAILIGFIFAAIHFELYGLVPRWLMGTAFVYLLYWSKSLWVPITAHCINNLIALIQYKMATPEELANPRSEYEFSAIAVCVSVIATGIALWVIRRMGSTTDSSSKEI